jgi:Zinc knuckle
LAHKLISRTPPLNKHTLTPWTVAAREEVVLNDERVAMLGPGGKRNSIVRDTRGKDWRPPKAQKKPQKDPDAMDVDVARTSNPRQTRRLTEEERTKLLKEGRCFRCGKQGHISKACPDKGKQQASNNPPREKGKARTTKIEEVKEDEQEEDKDSDGEDPPEYTEKNKAVIATIRALSTQDREQIFDYIMQKGF